MDMPWAGRRQAIIALGGLGLILLLGVGSWFVFFYHSPTCSDGIRNQNETGIDCGGLCSKLCQAPRVSALWARSVKVAPGVYHAVAMVQNPETEAGTTALPYTFSLYDADNILIAQRDGVMSLQPGEVVPLLETNILTGSRVPTRTFVDFKQAVWKRGVRPDSQIAVDSESLNVDGLSLSARITNNSTQVARKVTLTALLYDASDILVAASQTVLLNVPPRGAQTPVFTWQEPFSSDVVRFTVTARTE